MKTHYYTIRTYGRVYRANGPTYGATGSIGGIPAHYVRTHVRNAKLQGQDVDVIDEETGKNVTSLIWQLSVFKEETR